jgi:PHD/YefM family antitoxin component YafN of YafNO toxin-antitoxin module
MALMPSNNTHSVDELAHDAKKILAQLHRTGRPVLLTRSGKTNAVLVDVKTYERSIAAENFNFFVSEAEADVEAGRLIPARKTLARLKAKHAKKV